MTFGLQGPRASCMTYGHENKDSKEKTQQDLHCTHLSADSGIQLMRNFLLRKMHHGR